jgi:hypothetical protein
VPFVDETALELLGVGIVTGTTNPQTWLKSKLTIDTGDYDGVTNTYFEITADTNFAANQAVDLYNVTTSAVIATCNIPASQAAVTIQRSATFNLTSGANVYAVRCAGHASSVGHVWAARVIIQQSGATKCRKQYMLSSYTYNAASDTDAASVAPQDTLGSTTYGQTNADRYAHFLKNVASMSDIASGTPWSLEAVLSSSSSSGVPKCGLHTVAGTLVTGAETPDVTGTAITTQTVGFATNATNFADEGEFEAKIKDKNNASRTCRIHRCALYVRLSNASGLSKTLSLRTIALQKTTGTTAYQDANHRILYDASRFSGPVCYLEATGFCADNVARLHDRDTTATSGTTGTNLDPGVNFGAGTASVRARSAAISPTTGQYQIDGSDASTAGLVVVAAFLAIVNTGVAATTLTASSTLTAFTAASASLSHTPPTATTLTAASTLTAFTAGSASLASVVPTTLTAASTLTGFTAAAAALSHTPPAAKTLTAASTLTAFLAGAATIANTPVALTAASTLTAFTAGSASLAHTPATPTTLTAASTLTGFTASTAALAWSPATPKTLTAASTLTGFTAGSASIAWSAAPAKTLTAASTLTGFTAAAASLSWTAATPTILAAASTLTGFTAGAAAVSWTAAPARTLTAASTLTGFTAGSASIIATTGTALTAASTLTGFTAGTAAMSWTAAAATTLTAASTLTGFTAGAAALTWNPATPTTLTAASTLTGFVSASASLSHSAISNTTLSAASTLTATVSASADLIAALPTLMTAASTLTAVVSASASMGAVLPTVMTATSTLTGRIFTVAYVNLAAEDGLISLGMTRGFSVLRRTRGLASVANRGVTSSNTSSRGLTSAGHGRGKE